MSTFENKVEVVTDFLRNRASLNRLTDFQEVGRVTGEVLARRGQRHTARSVEREKIAEVLKAVDTQSLQTNDVLLSALVVHFWDNKPGHRFFEQAVERGMLEAEGGSVEWEAFHADQVAKAFAAHPDYVEVSREPVVPDDVSELDDEYEADEADEDEYEDSDQF